MGVDRRVDRKDKLGEVDQETGFFGANKPATTLSDVFAEAVERHRETRNVKDVADENALAIQ
jgi:hypothetical protein